MPRLLGVVSIVCLVIVPTRALRAGVYVTSEHKAFQFLRDPFPVITAQDTVNNMVLQRGTVIDERAKLARENSQDGKDPTDHADLAMEVASVLEPKQKAGQLTFDDRINLGAAYLRLGRNLKAVAVLKEGLDDVKEGAPERFLLLANLASAYQAAGDLRTAINTQHEALAAAPEKPPLAAWTPEQWSFYRIAERYYLTLLNLRNAEAERLKPSREMTLDNLFPKVRFAAANGQYEPGKIAPDSLHELPRDALQIVVQLLYWQPTDVRLMWLFGELLNAEGRVNEAFKTLGDLLYQNKVSCEELKRHRLVLHGAQTKKEDTGEKNLVVDVPTKVADDKPSTTLPDWRLLGTGFGAGILVALFGFMQIYLWSRRRGKTALRDSP